MRFFLSLVLSLIALSSSAETPKIESAFNLFSFLINSPSEQDMVETCQYYGLTDHGIIDGYQNFSYTDGTELSFKMDTISPKLCVPIIEMSTKLGKRQIEKNLNKLGYKKDGNTFIKGSEYAPVKSICTISKNKNSGKQTLLFTKLYL